VRSTLSIVLAILRRALAAFMVMLFMVGAMRAYHWVRHRRVLTVVIFHRVLQRSDARFDYCDREYTIEADVFGRCLDFFQEHYNVVSVDQVLEAGSAALPDRPLLITFDDGWADHQQVALPLLAKRQLPAVAFVAADAVDSQDARPFWETRLVHAFHRGTLSPDTLAALWRAAGPEPAPPFKELDDVLALVDRLLAVPSSDLAPLLARLEGSLSTPDRHTLTHEELLNLPAGGVAVGGHGASHQPLGLVPDAAADLRRAQAELAQRTGAPVRTMAFPKGSYNREAVDAARAEGYELVFTSDRVLNPIPPEGKFPPVLGRIGLDEHEMIDKKGRFRPEKLATRIWRQPIAWLDGDRPLRSSRS